jgi:hypothetical protein
METVNRYPTVDGSFARLHRAGWSIGETAGTTGWMVTGDNGHAYPAARRQVDGIQPALTADS